MSNHEEWNEFLGNLFNNALKDYQITKEHEFLKENGNSLTHRYLKHTPRTKIRFYTTLPLK